MSKKIYVVWHGKERGIFTEWEKCKDAINGFKGAKYKAFRSLEFANKAFADGYELHWGNGNSFKSQLSEEQFQLIGEPVYPRYPLMQPGIPQLSNGSIRVWIH